MRAEWRFGNISRYEFIFIKEVIESIDRKLDYIPFSDKWNELAKINCCLKIRKIKKLRYSTIFNKQNDIYCCRKVICVHKKSKLTIQCIKSYSTLSNNQNDFWHLVLQKSNLKIQVIIHSLNQNDFWHLLLKKINLYSKSPTESEKFKSYNTPHFLIIQIDIYYYRKIIYVQSITI